HPLSTTSSRRRWNLMGHQSGSRRSPPREEWFKQIHAFAALTDAINASGDRWCPGSGILVLIARAQLTERQARDLVPTLVRIQQNCRNFTATIGDERRQRCDAVSLCWLPGDLPTEGVS